MIYRLGNALDIDAVLNLVADMQKSERIGPHFHWTKELLQEELWQYNFVIASANDEFFSAQDKIGSTDGKLPQSNHENKFKSTNVAAFIVYRYLGDQLMEISALATGEAFLRQNRMFNLMVFLIEEEKPDEIWLEVHEKNQSAIDLYTKLGFFKSGQRPNYYSDRAAALNLVWKSQNIQTKSD